MSVSLSAATAKPVRRTLRASNLTRGVQYKVRVTNNSADQTSSRYSDDVYLAEINEVKYDDFTYPRSVLVGLSALATDQISGSINFSTVADAALVQVWNGSAWVVEWSRSPAWVCYDILTQPVFNDDLSVNRYDGLDPGRLVTPDFYAWAQYCAELVPDGKSGTEPRCLFDGVFDAEMPMWDAALEVCASARAQLVPRGVKIGVCVDTVRAYPSQIFTVGNTSENTFKETFLPMADRASAVEVEYLNADLGYARDRLAVVNAAVTDVASQRVTVALRGVTRTSQAWREAKLRLKRNELIARSGEIGAEIDSINCTVGDLVWVQSDVVQWGDGGRLKAGSTATVVQLDKLVTLVSGKTYEMRLRLADDSIHTRAITTPAGEVSAVTLDVALPSAPAEFDVWALGETGKAIKEFLVTDISRDGEQRARLMLVEYNASLYNVDAELPTLPTPDVSTSTATIADVSIEEVMERDSDGALRVHLDIRYTLLNGRSVLFSNGNPDGSWTSLGESMNGVFRVPNVVDGQLYILRLTPTNALRIAISANAMTLNHTVIGRLAVPGDVPWFAIDGTRLSWGAVPDLDLAGYAIRYQPGMSRSWGDAIPLHSGLLASSPYDMLTLPSGTVTLLIKAVDTIGNESANVAAIVANLGDPLAQNLIWDYDWHAAGFPGDIVAGEIEGGSGDLVAVVDASPMMWGDPLTGMWAVDQSTAMWASNTYGALDWQGELLIGAAEAGERLWLDHAIDGAAWSLQYRLDSATLMWTNDAAPMWSDDAAAMWVIDTWRPWPGEIVTQPVRYQFRITAQPGALRGRVSALRAVIDVPDIIERLDDVALSAGGSRLSITQTYRVIKNVSLTLQADGGSARSVKVIDKDAALGPLAQCFDGAGSGTAGTVDATIQGY